MADVELSSSERVHRESAMRTAAKAAAQHEGRTISDGFLDRVISESNLNLSVPELERYAVSRVEQAIHDPNAGSRNTFRDAADAYFQLRHGQMVSGYDRSLPWPLADARSDSGGASDKSSRSESYASLETSWDASHPQRLNEKNWAKSPFASIGGLDISTTKSLLASGFKTDQIMQAGRDVNKLEIDTKQNIARAARLNKDAPGFMPKAHRYKGDLDSIYKAEKAIAEDEARLAEMDKQGKGNSQEATALREHIARQKQEADRARQETQKRAEEAIKETPEKRKEDGRQIIRAIRENDMHRRHELGAHTLKENHEARLADNKAEGVQERVEAQREANKMDVRTRPDVANAEQDELEAFAAKREAQAKVEKTTNPPPQKETKTATTEPKQKQSANPPARQAVASTLASPKV